MDCTKYDLATGCVLAKLSVPAAAMQAQAGAGEGIIEGWLDENTEYVVAGQRRPRPSIAAPSKTAIIANGVDEAKFTDIPAGVVVTIDGEPVDTSDGELILTSSWQGDYLIEADGFPLMSFSATIRVGAA